MPSFVGDITLDFTWIQVFLEAESLLLNVDAYSVLTVLSFVFVWFSYIPD